MQDYLERGTKKRKKSWGDWKKYGKSRNRYRERNKARRCTGK